MTKIKTKSFIALVALMLAGMFVLVACGVNSLTPTNAAQQEAAVV